MSASQRLFDPVIEATQKVLANISELNLKVDLPKGAIACTKGNEKQVLENGGAKSASGTSAAYLEFPE